MDRILQTLRIQRWFSLATAVTTGVAALGFAAWATFGSLSVVGTGPAGSPVALVGHFDSSTTVDVFVDAPSPAVGYECAKGSGGALFTDLGGPSFEPRIIDGETWYWVGSTGRRAQSGDTVTCPAEGVTRVLLVDDRSAFARMMAIVLGIGSVLFTVLSAAIFLMTRRRDHGVPGDHLPAPGRSR